MARMDSKWFDSGDRFPDLELQAVSGDTIRFPADGGDGYSLIFFYRGYW